MAMVEVSYVATTWDEDAARDMSVGWGFSWGSPWGAGAQTEDDSRPTVVWVED